MHPTHSWYHGKNVTFTAHVLLSDMHNNTDLHLGPGTQKCVIWNFLPYSDIGSTAVLFFFLFTLIPTSTASAATPNNVNTFFFKHRSLSSSTDI